MKVRAWLAILGTTALVASIAGCSADEPKSADSGSWTVLSYSIADTNLEPEMMDDLTEMGQVGTQDGLNIVALVDRADGYSDDPLLGIDNWVGGKLLEIDDGSATELADMGNINTGDPQTLSDFIATGIANYPADHYSLILSDHGASWPGVGDDESFDDDRLSLAEITSGISAGLATAGVDKLDMLGFDACLMATYEVAHAMAPLADRMLASQQLEPGHGWNYTALATIPEYDGATVDELGGALIDGFAAQAMQQQTEDDITLALIDLTQMSTVDDAVAAFSASLIDQAAGVSPVVGRSLASSLGFGTDPDPTQATNMTDLAILAGNIGVDALNVSDQADAVIRAVNDVVLDKVDGQATKGATGLSIYFPPTSEYYNDDYSALGVDDDWVQFLKTYYGEGDAIPADEHPQFTSDADVSFDEDGLTISGVFDSIGEDNIAESYIRYGIIEDDGSTTFLGKEEAFLTYDGTSTASGTYDLTRMTITDGEDTAYAFLDLTTDEEGDTVNIDVPIAFYAVNSDVAQNALLSLVLDGATGDLTSETYYTHDGDLYGALSPDPDGVIVPEQLNIADDGTETWVGTTETGLYADLPNLEYDLEDLPSGTQLYIELWVVDFGGNKAKVSAVVEVP